MKMAISYSTQISSTNDAFYSSYSFKILMHCPLFVTLSWLIKCIDLIDHSQLYYSLIQGSKLSNRVIAHVYVISDQQTSYHQFLFRRKHFHWTEFVKTRLWFADEDNKSLTYHKQNNWYNAKVCRYFLCIRLAR